MGPSSNRKKRLNVQVVSMADGGAGRKESELTPNPEEVSPPDSTLWWLWDVKNLNVHAGIICKLLKYPQVVIDNVANWKRRQGLYPASAPYTPIPGSGKSKLWIPDK